MQISKTKRISKRIRKMRHPSSRPKKLKLNKRAIWKKKPLIRKFLRRRQIRRRKRKMRRKTIKRMRRRNEQEISELILFKL